jgi:peptide/nickel transport system substrate-binding protein
MRRFLCALAFVLGLFNASMIAPAAAQGTLRVALGTTLSQLDPAKTTIGDEYVYVHLVFNGLSRIDPDMSVKPDLAESWTASDDLKTWTFKLRQGVKFHHGRVLDSEDVVATVKRILDPETGSRARTNLTMVESVEAVDPLTVRFHLNESYAGFADVFADRQMRIVPKDKLAELSTQPIGTGPFVFKSWSPGDRLELTKNPDYFEKGMPKLDGASFRNPRRASRRSNPVRSISSGACPTSRSTSSRTIRRCVPTASRRRPGMA